jgi:regulator of protease activity HflC (stomatin/prohibitin superfamily)
MKSSKSIKLGLSVALVGVMFSGCYMETINSGEVGVETSTGSVNDKPLLEGFHISLNPMTELNVFTARQKKLELSAKPPKTEGESETNEISYDAPLVVLTSEQLQVPVEVTMTYHILKDKAPFILKEQGQEGVYEQKIVIPMIRSVAREVIGTTNIDGLISKRSEFQQKIVVALNKNWAKYGLVCDEIQIRDIGIPESIQKSVQAKLQAEQDAIKATYLVKQAEQEAKIEVAKQQGIADANKILLSSITPELIRYKELQIKQEEIAKWNGVTPTTVLGGANTTYLVK